MSRKYTLWLALLLFIIALSVRLVPIHFSSLPYNIDGFPLAKISESIIETGYIPSSAESTGLISYNLKMPVFSTVLACFSLVFGVSPLELLPYFCALVGSLAVVFIYAFTQFLTKSRMAAFSAGLFAALSGLFVYVTAAAMKQLLAIVFLTFIFYLYPRRESWRHRIVLCMVLILLPFTHHLTTLIALLALSIALAGSAFRRHQGYVSEKSLVIDLIAGPGILLCSLLYYRSVNMEFYSEVGNISDAVLLASVFVLAAVTARILSGTLQTKPWLLFGRKKDRQLTASCIFDEKVLVLILGIFVLYLNSKVQLFVGGPLTSGLLLKLLLPYLILIVLGMMGLNVIRYTRFQYRYLVVAMFLAPICVMIFAMLRGLDVFDFMLVYRSYNFIDIPLAVACGIGIAFLYSRAKEYSKKHRDFSAMPAGIFIVFCVLCVATVPLAYSNEKAFGIQEVTYEYEFEAMRWTSESGIGSVVTDQRYGDIINPYYNISADRTGPWRIKSYSLHEGERLFVSYYWEDGGAQMSILGRVVFDNQFIEQYFSGYDVLYVGGPQGREVVISIVR